MGYTSRGWKGPSALAGILVLGSFLMSCSFPVPAVSPPQTVTETQTETTEQPASNQGQMLPITAQVTIGGQIIQLEVAQTEEQQAMGLMYRTHLPGDRGMLFPFSPARRVGFWMKNCRIALDMVFLYQGQVRAIAAKAPPCKADPCPVYGPPNQLIDQVIELRAGRSAELGLKVGDRLVVQDLR